MSVESFMWSWAPPLSLIISALPCYLGCVSRWGRRQTAGAWILLLVFAFGVEAVAIATGYPYGEFVYVLPIGPHVAGTPLLVGVAWTPLIIGSLTIARRIKTKYPLLLAILILVATDMILDPGAVAIGLWKYVNTSGFYAVPWSNFGGWMISGSLGIWLANHMLPYPTHGYGYRLLTSTWLMTICSWSVINIIHGHYLTLPIAVLLLMLWYRSRE